MGRGLRSIRKARGWSQDRLIFEMERYARERLVDIAATASLKTYVSEWENGKRAISARYAEILRPLLGVTDAELRGEPEKPTEQQTGGYEDLLSRIDSARSISDSMVKTFFDQTELLRTMDREMGAASLVDQMTSHLGRMEDALTFAVLPGTRRPIATALAGAATLAAWQALDAGSVERAWRHYELAKRAAQDADSPLYLAHAMGEQAYVLRDAGRPGMAVELIRDAQRTHAGRQSPRLKAWLSAAEAELCAAAGMGDDARRALEQAAAALPEGEDARDADMVSIFLNSGHLARWRGNVLALLGDSGAMEDLYAALNTVDGSFVRARSGLHSDLVQAHLARGELDEARSHLQQARLLANRTGSVRFRRRVEMLTGRL
ncbi:helix-turn-helix domain-containing protein [Streptomyces sp. NPDC048340]|uniref:helix-turn-helix domain-containing protein n=1 Tax=Streptomyces sp. NPDC048340 TaxID=3365537 RepID=UPI00371DFE13